MQESLHGAVGMHGRRILDWYDFSLVYRHLMSMQMVCRNECKVTDVLTFSLLSIVAEEVIHQCQEWGIESAYDID